MKKASIILAFALMAILIVGCGTSPTVTPAASPTPQVVTVVITATPPPPTATPAQPTLTPIPTVALTATVSSPTPASVAVATKPAATAKPAATRTPTKVATPPTATALPMKFAAPNINKPIWIDGGQRDEVVFDGGAIIFDWQSVGGLAGDECYLIQVRTDSVNPGPASRSDYWLVNCGDQTPIGVSVKFTLESPNRGSPNYGSIKNGSDQMWAYWSVTVVKNLGQCDTASKFKCKYAPISPSGTNHFLFKGA